METDVVKNVNKSNAYAVLFEALGILMHPDYEGMMFQYEALHGIFISYLPIRLSKVIDKVVDPAQSALVKDHQILDGPSILNETVKWYKKMKKQLMIFKVDFIKAYDSLAWNYLLDIRGFRGFGTMWINMIKECHKSSTGSVLINENPMKDLFSIEILEKAIHC
ncbi:uncharacterized protein LOC143632750 [Bidens hawaiensis]|uniref:uncharacterized protein LOC143632750 n=1 Tax=Bidens hawaiensis TaxID=980011 RepID=UPI00404B6F07